MKRLGLVMALVGALGAVGASIPEQAMAQEAPPPEQVNASGKGTIGLGLIGAELGFVIPALAGLDDTWAFIVFPVLGAAGGALAGYFLLDEPNHPEVAITLLAVGIAAIIPTMVITLSATAYDPEDEEAVERLEDEEAPAGPDPDEEMMEESGGSMGTSGSIGGSTEPAPAPAEPPPAPEGGPTSRRDSGSGLIRLNEAGVFVGMPALSVAPTYTQDEVFRFGVEQHAELNVPVLSGQF